MGSEIIAGELPSLAPIRTIAVRDDPVEGPPEASNGVEEEECVTPKSEEHMLKPVLACPPAPKKPRPAKRKSGPPSRAFYAVPSDLTSVFLALASSPQKRIRVG